MQHYCILSVYLLKLLIKSFIRMKRFFLASWLIASLATVLILTTSCNRDPELPNEEELITTLIYTLTPTAGGAPVVLSYRDLDGDGGNPPVITTGNLTANTTYNGTIVLLNESKTPAEDITAEVRAEGKAHQLFFRSTVSGMTITYTDTDADGRPIGLSTQLSTGARGSGNLTITLRHNPNKAAAGVAQGNIANAGGETDIETTFDINVQ